jgi:hypothetical protein
MRSSCANSNVKEHRSLLKALDGDRLSIAAWFHANGRRRFVRVNFPKFFAFSIISASILEAVF